MNNDEQRKTTGDNDEQQPSSVTVVGVRFAEGLLRDLDAEVEKRKQAAPWAETTRAEVIREAVYKLLHKIGPEAAPRPVSAPAPKAMPTPKDPSVPRCLVCGELVPPRNKALCGKPACQKESHRRREADRRKAVKGNRPPSD